MDETRFDPHGVVQGVEFSRPGQRDQIERLRTQIGLSETDVIIGIRHHYGLLLDDSNYAEVLGSLTVEQARDLIHRMSAKFDSSGS